MENVILEKNSLFGLIRNLADETKTFIRQEAQLVKTELFEKLSRLGRNTATLAVGGAVAYAGLVVFIMGLCWLLAWTFQQAGLAPLFAGFVGLAAIGLLVTVIGGVLLLLALKSISQQSITPGRSLQTLAELSGAEAAPATRPRPVSEPSQSSAELQSCVEATESRLGETLDELGRRVSPTHLKAKAAKGIKDRPYYSSLAAMVTGFLSAFLIRRRFHRA